MPGPDPLPAAALQRKSLAVCFATAAQVADPPDDLGALTQPSGTWLHQVRTTAGPTHMARSSRQGFGGDDLEVEQRVETQIAAKLDNAMTWVDRSLPNDKATVRLLVIPAYYVHALLILPGRKVSAVLVDQPQGFTQLQVQQEYPLKTFLKRLARERVGGSLV